MQEIRKTDERWSMWTNLVLGAACRISLGFTIPCPHMANEHEPLFRPSMTTEQRRGLHR